MLDVDHLEQHVVILLILGLDGLLKVLSLLMYPLKLALDHCFLSTDEHLNVLLPLETVLIPLLVLLEENLLPDHFLIGVLISHVNSLDLLHEVLEKFVILSRNLVHIILEFVDVAVYPLLNTVDLGAIVGSSVLDKLIHLNDVRKLRFHLLDFCLGKLLNFGDTKFVFSLNVRTFLELVKQEIMLIYVSFVCIDLLYQPFLEVFHLLESLHGGVYQLVNDVSNPRLKAKPIETCLVSVHSL